VIRHARERRLGHVEDEARATSRGRLLYQPQQEAPNDEWIAHCRDVDAVDRVASPLKSGGLGHVLGQHDGAEQLEVVAVPGRRSSVALPVEPHIAEWN